MSQDLLESGQVPGIGHVGQLVGGRLRAIRLERGLSVREVARRARSFGPIISRLEAGHHSPSLGLLARAAAALDVDLLDVVQVLDEAWEKGQAA